MSLDRVLADEAKKASGSQTTLKEAFANVKITAQVLMEQFSADEQYGDTLRQQGEALEEITKKLIDKSAYIDAWAGALEDLKNDRGKSGGPCHSSGDHGERTITASASNNYVQVCVCSWRGAVRPTNPSPISKRYWRNTLPGGRPLSKWIMRGTPSCKPFMRYSTKGWEAKGLMMKKRRSCG